jgi:hypothetical protein
MVILVQVLRRRLLRQAVIVKIKVFLPKKSMSRFHMWWLSVLTFVDCLEKSERLRIMLRESAYLVRMTRLVMLLLVSVHSCLSAPQRIKGFLDTEDGHEMSRSSSVSTKDRSGKRASLQNNAEKTLIVLMYDLNIHLSSLSKRQQGQPGHLLLNIQQ